MNEPGDMVMWRFDPVPSEAELVTCPRCRACIQRGDVQVHCEWHGLNGGVLGPFGGLF